MKLGAQAWRVAVSLSGQVFVEPILCVMSCVWCWGCKSEPDISDHGWVTSGLIEAPRPADATAVHGRGHSESCLETQIPLTLKI